MIKKQIAIILLIIQIVFGVIAINLGVNKYIFGAIIFNALSNIIFGYILAVMFFKKED